MTLKLTIEIQFKINEEDLKTISNDISEAMYEHFINLGNCEYKDFSLLFKTEEIPLTIKDIPL